MYSNNTIKSKYLFNSDQLIKYLNSVKNISLKSIEIESGRIFQRCAGILRTSANDGNMIINFCEIESKHEIITAFKFRGITILDDLSVTIDVSTFSLNLAAKENDQHIFCCDIHQSIKEIGTYNLSIKNKEYEIEIDTSLYVELIDGYTLLFEDVHDMKYDRFYYFRNEEIDKTDTFKTFCYEESRFIDWNKKVLKRF